MLGGGGKGKVFLPLINPFDLWKKNSSEGEEMWLRNTRLFKYATGRFDAEERPVFYSGYLL